MNEKIGDRKIQTHFGLFNNNREEKRPEPKKKRRKIGDESIST